MDLPQLKPYNNVAMNHYSFIVILSSDIDECAEGYDDCHQTCVNTEGSYVCDCSSGYLLSSDGVSCEGLCNVYIPNYKVLYK